MPFMEEDAYGAVAARFTQFTYGPIIRHFRHRNINKKYDIEPAWRSPKPELTTGYRPRNYARGTTSPPREGA